MREIFAVLLVIAIIFSFTSCSSEAQTQESSTQNEISSVASIQNEDAKIELTATGSSSYLDFKNDIEITFADVFSLDEIYVEEYGYTIFPSQYDKTYVSYKKESLQGRDCNELIKLAKEVYPEAEISKVDENTIIIDIPIIENGTTKAILICYLMGDNVYKLEMNCDNVKTQSVEELEQYLSITAK